MEAYARVHNIKEVLYTMNSLCKLSHFYHSFFVYGQSHKNELVWSSLGVSQLSVAIIDSSLTKTYC